MAADPLRVTVVVPTYRRPEQLAGCLAGIDAQTRPADEVVVVRREDDLATRDHLAGSPELIEVTVTEPGVLAAMNAGVAASTGEVIAFVDDDAVPRPDWIAGLVGPFADPRVGAVGGRDDVHTLADPGLATEDEVGLITSWGKLIGGHHLGRGPARDVTVLKGVNMAFRREALALPRTLRGAGAQVHFEVATGLWARQHGWRLTYDPAIVVDHYPGPRFDPDRRERPDPVAAYDAAYNLVTCLVSLRPELAWRRAVYGLLVGDAMTPGVVRALVAAGRRDPVVTARFLPSIRGQVRALADHRRGRTVDMVAAPSVSRAIVREPGPD